MSRYDTTTLIQRVKRSQSLSQNSSTFSDADILDFLNTEFTSTVIPEIQKCIEEYFVVTYDIHVDTGSTESQFEIPSEATGLRLRDVYLVNTNGAFSNLPRLTPTQAASYGWQYGSYTSNNNTVNNLSNIYGFYLQGNRLQVFPPGLLPGKTLRMTFMKRPNELCLTTDAGKIINIAGGYIVLNNTPTDWEVGTIIDAIDGRYPFEFVTNTNVENIVYASPIPLTDVPILSLSGNTISIDPAATALLKVGDYLVTPGTAPVPQFIPYELYNILVQSAAIRCLESLNDREGQQMAIDKYKQMLASAITTISPRVEGKAKKITNKNSILQNVPWRTRYAWRR